MDTFEEMNAVWDAWIDPENPPARACIEARLARPQFLGRDCRWSPPGETAATGRVAAACAAHWCSRCSRPAARADAGERPRCVVLGDSLSAGYGIALEDGLGEPSRRAARRAREPAWEVVNASISGDTTRGGRARLPGPSGRGAPPGDRDRRARRQRRPAGRRARRRRGATSRRSSEQARGAGAKRAAARHAPAAEPRTALREAASTPSTSSSPRRSTSRWCRSSSRASAVSTR